MGQEISGVEFHQRDFKQFQKRLYAETEILQEWFRNKTFSKRSAVGGFELEAWLLDREHHPAARNTEYLERLNNELVVPELALFNVEMNSSPLSLQSDALSRMQSELQGIFDVCSATAEEMDMFLAMIGSLPTVTDTDLVLKNMSLMQRYKALNQQVMRLREGRPLQLNILGQEHLQSTHYDVMLESAATSFQIHLQVPQDQAVRFYNASMIASGPMVAACTNAPFLFGKSLWSETRIPLFEQAVEIGGIAGAAFGPVRRVSFGTGYARESLFECFAENRDHFPVLLPIDLGEAPDMLAHLRLHNGTIWRWTRPLIGFDYDGRPHLRIEHRTVPAGPTVVDSIANAALFFGLAYAFATQSRAPEYDLEFPQARDNFYNAAKHGLDANFIWQGERVPARTLLLEELLPQVRQCLAALHINNADINKYIGIITERIESKQTGAHWQRAYVEKHQANMQQLTAAYLQHQQQGEPVHTWPV